MNVIYRLGMEISFEPGSRYCPVRSTSVGPGEGQSSTYYLSTKFGSDMIRSSFHIRTGSAWSPGSISETRKTVLVRISRKCLFPFSHINRSMNKQSFLEFIIYLNMMPRKLYDSLRIRNISMIEKSDPKSRPALQMGSGVGPNLTQPVQPCLIFVKIPFNKSWMVAEQRPELPRITLNYPGFQIFERSTFLYHNQIFVLISI